MSSFQKIPLWKGKGCKYLKWGLLCCLLGMVCIVQLPEHTVSGSLLLPLPYKLLLHVHRRDCWVSPRWLAQRVKGQMVSLAAVLKVRLSGETDPVPSISGCWILHYFNFSFIFLMCMGILPACMSVDHVIEVFHEARRRHWIPWCWSYRWLWAVTWVLGIEPRFFARIASFLNDWAFSPDLIPYYFWTAESGQKHRVEIKEIFLSWFTPKEQSQDPNQIRWTLVYDTQSQREGCLPLLPAYKLPRDCSIPSPRSSIKCAASS